MSFCNRQLTVIFFFVGLHDSYFFPIIKFADCPCSEVHLVSVSQSAEPSKHEVSLLLDNKFVMVLSMARSTAPDILVVFDIKSTGAKENIQLGLVKEVRRCHKFFFTLLTNGVVCILCILETRTAFVNGRLSTGTIGLN